MDKMNKEILMEELEKVTGGARIVDTVSAKVPKPSERMPILCDACGHINYVDTCKSSYKCEECGKIHYLAG